MGARIFRFDDVCLNSDADKESQMASVLMSLVPDCDIWFCVSPLAHDVSGETSPEDKERVFPSVFNAMSDHRLFYKADFCHIPHIPNGVVMVNHGLFHVDHRLLSMECQEMSILAGASLTGSDIFVPPFNKWNSVTESVCRDAKIRLVKFEEGWRNMRLHPHDSNHGLYYLHSRDFRTVADLEAWFQ